MKEVKEEWTTSIWWSNDKVIWAGTGAHTTTRGN
jgi:hypothetical protein